MIVKIKKVWNETKSLVETFKQGFNDGRMCNDINCKYNHKK